MLIEVALTALRGAPITPPNLHKIYETRLQRRIDLLDQLQHPGRAAPPGGR